MLGELSTQSPEFFPFRVIANCTGGYATGSVNALMVHLERQTYEYVVVSCPSDMLCNNVKTQTARTPYDWRQNIAPLSFET